MILIICRCSGSWSASEVTRTTAEVYPYIQSRFYRSPEVSSLPRLVLLFQGTLIDQATRVSQVLLGVPYTSAIDMWSLGPSRRLLFHARARKHTCTTTVTGHFILTVNSVGFYLCQVLLMHAVFQIHHSTSMTRIMTVSQAMQIHGFSVPCTSQQTCTVFVPLLH